MDVRGYIDGRLFESLAVWGVTLSQVLSFLSCFGFSSPSFGLFGLSAFSALACHQLSFPLQDAFSS
jgi:hypothetical protein